MTYKSQPCPECGAWTDVMETRKRKNGTIARRIECANLHRFTLYEAVPVPQQTAVQTIDRTKRPSRQNSVRVAVRHGTGLPVHAHGSRESRPSL